MECKHHVVILPKYRRKVTYGRLRRGIGPILRDLRRQKDIELVEGKAMPDHIHMLLSVPLRYSIAMTVGYLKSKSATRIHRELLHTKGTLFGRSLRPNQEPHMSPLPLAMILLVLELGTHNVVEHSSSTQFDDVEHVVGSHVQSSESSVATPQSAHDVAALFTLTY